MLNLIHPDEEELQWYVPAAILPAELQNIITVITQFLETPFNLEGKKASQLISKKTRRRRRVKAPESDADEGDEDETRQRKKEKKKKEEVQYKSAQFIEDSDAEYGDLELFLEQEKKKREKLASAAVTLGEGKSGAMRAMGTKKRRRKAGDTGNGKKKRKGDQDAMDITPVDSASSSSEDESTGGPTEVPPDKPSEPVIEKPRPRPKPRPKPRKSKSRSPSALIEGEDGEIEGQMGEFESTKSVPRRKGRLVVSDEDD